MKEENYGITHEHEMKTIIGDKKDEMKKKIRKIRNTSTKQKVKIQ